MAEPINLPNAISVLRICLVPVFLAVFWSSAPYRLELSMGILALAGLTDILDGHLARKFNLITPVGKILDPLADKLMVITVMISLFLVGKMPLWLVILVIAKDLLLVAGSFFVVLRQKVPVSASIYGKAATIAIYIALFSGAFDIRGRTLTALMAGLVSLLALSSYVNGFIRQRAC